jgi:hypothetical protein
MSFSSKFSSFPLCVCVCVCAGYWVCIWPEHRWTDQAGEIGRRNLILGRGLSSSTLAYLIGPGRNTTCLAPSLIVFPATPYLEMIVAISTNARRACFAISSLNLQYSRKWYGYAMSCLYNSLQSFTLTSQLDSACRGVDPLRRGLPLGRLTLLVV